jgi:hypothetical protein
LGIELGHPQEEINKAFDNMCEAITKIQVASIPNLKFIDIS